MNDRCGLILVVEDEENIRYSLVSALRREGYRTLEAESGEEALDLAKTYSPDMVLLDLMLPDISGLDVCRLLRRESDVPVVIVTARDAEPDIIGGLEMGADDYVTKPFSLSVLLARIRANLRRNAPEKNLSQVAVGNLSLDAASRTACVSERLLELTPRLFSLLLHLAQRVGVVCGRDEILNEVWGYDYFGETRTVDVHIHWLRRKLADAGADVSLETVRGVGYRLVKGQ
ncbi:MAG: response regulator transcription factor [Bacillota bacterium]